MRRVYLGQQIGNGDIILKSLLSQRFCLLRCNPFVEAPNLLINVCRHIKKTNHGVVGLFIMHGTFGYTWLWRPRGRW